MFFSNFSPTSSHLHLLQVENCDSNLRLVVDENDNGKFSLERVNAWSSNLPYKAKSQYVHIVFLALHGTCLLGFHIFTRWRWSPCYLCNERDAFWVYPYPVIGSQWTTTLTPIKTRDVVLGQRRRWLSNINLELLQPRSCSARVYAFLSPRP